MSRRYIRISGDVVELVNEQTEALSHVDDFYQTLREQLSYRSPLLPVPGGMGTLLVEEESREKVVVVQQNPGEYSIPYRSDQYSVFLPYVIFFIYFRDGMIVRCYCYIRPEKVTSLQDMLYGFPLPNVNDANELCFGAMEVNSSLPDHTRVEELINQLYLTDFNNDLDGNLAWYKENWFAAHDINWRGFLTKWQEQTRRDPVSILNFPMKEEETIEEKLERMINNG